MTQQATTSQASAPKGRKITLLNAVGYAFGDFYGGGFGQIATYLTLFWTTFAGLKVAQAGSIVGIATMLAAFSALVFGTLSDSLYKYKIGRKFGRRRFLILLGVPLLLVTILMFVPGMPFWAYFVVYALWIIANQLIMTPYSVLPNEMTTDFNGRTMLSTTRMLFSGISTAVVPLGMAAFLKALGDKQSSSYTISMGCFIALFAVCVFIAYKSTWELTPEEAGFDEVAIEAQKKEAFDFGKWLKGVGDIFVGYFSTLRNKTFRKHILIYLLGQSFLDIFGQVWLFFVLYNLNKPVAFGSALLGMALIGEPLKPVFGWLFAKLGPRKMFSLNFAGAIIGLLGLWGLWQTAAQNETSAWNAMLYVVMVWWLIFRAMTWFIPWNVFPFIPDVDMIMAGENRGGLYIGFQQFARKITAGLSAMAWGWFLGANGFVEDAFKAGKPQPDQAVNAIGTVLVWWIIAGLAIAWIISFTLKLDKKTDAVLLKEIDRLQNGGKKADVDPETKKVVEQLTGVKYEKCWPQTAE
ncbi:major facilitator superfamily protein [Bifidobacterium myosotis]|uniref:Major facilitator superfamily protein n=1 Tax=Bifidobacterium myosotis TaxID=1630166 RepID=A0A261FHW1_9BIFI|nr:MFS transporter [Bifidobacterium myosotis]OZG58563.1 major facilitator superfamily protein [Bifidobacterium myosotis]